jgi:predicted ATP-grasp superfamily ATP-dependent carboligase
VRWRVLVLDASARQALAAVRSLGRRGHDVGTAGYRPIELAGLSRYAARYHELPDPRGAAEPFARALVETIESHSYDVVIASDEATLARFRADSPTAPTYPKIDDSWVRLTDKVTLAELCTEAHVAYPRTLSPASEADDPAAVSSVGTPVVVKPVRSAEAGVGGVAMHVGATITSDAAEALAAVISLRELGLPPIVQQHIPRKDKVNLTVFRRGGQSEMRFVYRVIRDVPLTGGIAMATQTIDPHGGVGAAAIDALERVLDTAGYEGVANGEFVVDESGELVLIEVNPRLWGSTWFAERLGQRVVERGIRHALQLEPLPSVAYPVGRRFHHLAGELRWLSLHPNKRTAALDLARSLRPRDVFEYDDWSDAGALARYALLRLRRAR